MSVRVSSYRSTSPKEETHSLEHLLSANILQPRVEVPDALRDILDLALVGALNLAGLADGHVEAELDATIGCRGAQPSLAAAGGGGREADLVLARLSCVEGEPAARGASLGYHAVIVVE